MVLVQPFPKAMFFDSDSYNVKMLVPNCFLRHSSSGRLSVAFATVLFMWIFCGKFQINPKSGVQRNVLWFCFPITLNQSVCSSNPQFLVQVASVSPSLSDLLKGLHEHETTHRLIAYTLENLRGCTSYVWLFNQLVKSCSKSENRFLQEQSRRFVVQALRILEFESGSEFV